MRTREDLLSASRGYWQARALLTAVEIGVFDALGRRRLKARTIAKRTDTDAGALGLLLDALVGQGVLSKRTTAYGIRRELVPLLTPGPQSALSMLRHHAALWERWERLTSIVRTGVRGKDVSGFRGGPEAALAFTKAMCDGARRFAAGVAEELPLRGRRLLLDLGGGPGAYAAAFLRRHPKLQVLVVDLPDVCSAARQLASREWSFGERLAWYEADFDAAPLPKGADVAFLSHVIHSQSEDEVRSLFRKIRRALEPGGLLIVRDFFTSKERTQPPSASLFALNMLVNTAAGRTYSTSETQAWLREAGFAKATFRRSKVAPDASYVLATS